MEEKIKAIYESTEMDFSEKVTLVNDFDWPKNWVKIFFKRYPRMKSFQLVNTPYSSAPLTKLNSDRVSTRNFKDEKISYEDLSHLIYYSAGIKNSVEHTDKTRRMYPSAGARYPIELYVINNNVEDLEGGLYHYNVKDNNLELLLQENLIPKSNQIFGTENYKGNPNYIILTGVMSRTEVKYGSNAYRFALLEAGHIGQNISLISSDKLLGCCAIGGFDNKKLVNLIDLTEDEIPLYAFALGKPAA